LTLVFFTDRDLGTLFPQEPQLRAAELSGGIRSRPADRNGSHRSVAVLQRLRRQARLSRTKGCSSCGLRTLPFRPDFVDALVCYGGCDSVDRLRGIALVQNTTDLELFVAFLVFANAEMVDDSDHLWHGDPNLLGELLRAETVETQLIDSLDGND
jgi:hypothetical protein